MMNLLSVVKLFFGKEPFADARTKYPVISKELVDVTLFFI